MKISENKKPNKYAVLVTYLIALLCLLAGLFLPLFGGKEILALQLPGALNSVAGSDVLSFGKPFSLQQFCVVSFGLEGFSLDIAAVLVLLYALVTVLGLLALIPIGISTKKGTKTSCVFAYIIEIAAVLVLSVYIVCILEIYPLADFGYNMLIAFGGSLLMLLLLACMDKKGTGAANLFLWLFGAVALFMLFDVLIVIPALGEVLVSLEASGISPLFFGTNSGIEFLHLLFGGGLSEVMTSASSVWDKITVYASIALALVVIINFLLDVLFIAHKAKKSSLLQRIIRYALALLIAICLMIAVLVSKQPIGLLFIVLMLMVALQLAMSVIRLCMYNKKVKALAEEAYEKEHTLKFEKPVKKPAPVKENKQLTLIDGIPEPTVTEPEIETVTVKDNGSVQLEITEQSVYDEPAMTEPVEAAAETTPSEQVITNETIEPAEPIIEEVQPVEPAAPIEEVNPVEPEAQPEEDKPSEPVEAVEEEKPVETVAPVEEEKPAELVTDIEEVKPIEPAAPIEEVKPAEPIAPAEEIRPVRPVTPVEDIKPVRPVEPVTSAPVHNVQSDPHIYTINQIYGGPVDEFMKKLTNDERIEFAQTFIEFRKGGIGNIPEYVIGGDNRKFFSSVFIYLGRIRGMISDGLLNKMFKELNMM